MQIRPETNSRSEKVSTGRKISPVMGTQLYTILFGPPGPLANNKLMYKNLPFDPKQAFTPIVLVAKSPLIIAAKASLPVKDIQELKAYAKANAGKLNVGMPGNGTLGHITSVLVQRELGVSMTDVPYRGTALVVNDLLGGQVDLAMDFMPSQSLAMQLPEDWFGSFCHLPVAKRLA